MTGGRDASGRTETRRRGPACEPGSRAAGQGAAFGRPEPQARLRSFLQTRARTLIRARAGDVRVTETSPCRDDPASSRLFGAR